MANDLVQDSDVADFPGAPYGDAALDAAAAQIREKAGWHIAPSRTETVTLDGTTGSHLVLPSRKVTSVAAVRDVTNPAAPVVLTGWRLLKASAMLERDEWPYGIEVLEVDLTHGHTDCPPDLFPLAAAVARSLTSDAAVSREKTGPFEREFADSAEVAAAAANAWSALDPYLADAGF